MDEEEIFDLCTHQGIERGRKKKSGCVKAIIEGQKKNMKET